MIFLRSTFARTAFGRALAALGIMLAVRAAPGRAQDSVTAFIDVNVIPMDRERVLPHQTVVVRGHRIVALGDMRKTRPPAAARRIDGRGKYLMPGLADMHTHIGMLTNVGHEEQVLLMFLAGGVTTVRNMDHYQLPSSLAAKPLPPQMLLGLRARIQIGELLGPRIYTSGLWRTDTTKSVDENVAAYKAAGFDHLKLYTEYGSPILDSVLRAAHRLGMPVVGHGTGDLQYDLTLGLKSFEHGLQYDPGASDDSLRARVVSAARAGVWNCLGPIKDIWYSQSDRTWLDEKFAGNFLRAWLDFDTTLALGAARAYLEPDSSSIAFSRSGARGYYRLLKALHDGGARLLLGSDEPAMAAFLPGSEIHYLLRTLVAAGLTPYQALEVVTRNVAAYFGTADSAGTVTVGKRADLLLLRGNPLKDIRHSSDLDGVMANGRWLSRQELEQRLTAAFRWVPVSMPSISRMKSGTP